MNPTDLEAAWLALGADKADAGEIRLAALDAANDAGPLYLARDSQGRLHLLAPLPSGRPVQPDRRSKGVGIERNEYVIGATRTPCLDVICFEPGLDDVFRRLTVEMVSAIVDDPTNSISVCQKVLSRWRQMLERRRAPLNYGDLVGLFGELHVLRRYIGRDPAHRLSAWVGPTGAVHDFQVHDLAVEVKSTTTREGRFAEIHGVEQLEPPPGRELALVFLRLRADDSGTSVAEIVDSIKGTGADAIQLDEIVAATGWEPSPDEPRFVVTEELFYRVDAAFPRIVPGSFVSGALPAGLLRLRYDVDLTGAHPAPFDTVGSESVLDRLAGAP